ncbi:MAG TPA: peroxiredoxin [Candidatus Saccharimonadales bacterium]|nr:peroxiredoxin [Candidatus Saccharimonadales bacterium]
MEQAADFTLKDQHGNTRSLHEWRGKWVVLYFYPKDETTGCTQEACSFRDANEALLARDAIVVGVSKDSPESHAKFIRHYQLPFTLLSDPDGEVMKQYSSWTPIFAKRQTFIINPEGNIAKVYPKVTPAQHATEILNDLAVLQSH